MNNPHSVTIANGATATSAKKNLPFSSGLSILFAITIDSGTPTIALQGSIDGTTFYPLPSLDAITASGFKTFDGPLPWVRAVVASGTGTATVKMSWSDNR